MVVKRVDKDQQIELWRRAHGGCRAAGDDLAMSLAAWVRMKATELGRRFEVPFEDLESAAWARFPACVRCFDPGTGFTFSNYFFNAAGRAMAAECRKHAAGPGREVRSDAVLGLVAARACEDPRHAAAAAAMASLPAMARRAIDEAEGIHGRRRAEAKVAKRVRLTEEQLLAAVGRGLAAVRAAVEAVA